MRTTLTLADDVAVSLDELRRARRTTLKALVNEALREGLKQMRTPPRRSRPFQTQSVDLGPLLIGSIDSASEALAIAEGDSFK